jgi:SAM-dependent methyltransferase
MIYTEHSYAESELAYKEFLKPSLIQAIECLQIQKDYKILDAGCGPGAMFQYFADKLGSTGQIIGMDASEIHLNKAAQIIFQNGIEKLVTLTKADLFKELPFDNNSFDLIWLSDVLFPDDFGNEINNTIKNLLAKLKSGGKIAIFYGNWLKLSLLPGRSILEHSISIANEKRKSVLFQWLPEVHPENALEWLRNSDLINCRNNYYTSCYQAPLAENIKSYIHWHLTNIYQKAIEYKGKDFQVSDTLIKEFERITDTNSADYILNKQHYHCAIHGQLTIGQKK